MTNPTPVQCDLWPVDMSVCCPEWADLTEDQQLIYQARATEILDNLTGQQFGVCEITVRPCSDHRMCPLPAEYWASGPGDMYPYILNGKWHNTTCSGSAGCDCVPPCSARLDPGPVLDILEVSIDGVVLPAVNPDTGRPSYVVYDWRYLVRTDGCCWPDCQDWNQTPAPPEAGDPVTCGVWTVKYRFGNPVPIGGVYANSALACELMRAGCNSSDCRLPAGAVTVVRDGITIQLDPKQWINNLPDVASWVHIVNPAALISPPVFLSPKRRPRVQTWP